MFILNKPLEVNSNALKIKEATGFNPANTALIERNGVAYGLSYQDNGNGTSKVKLLISPLYQSKTYECDTGINVADEFKGQLSLTLIENSAEIDKVGIIFPDERTNKEEKNHIRGLTFSTYKSSIQLMLLQLSIQVKLNCKKTLIIAILQIKIDF